MKESYEDVRKRWSGYKTPSDLGRDFTNFGGLFEVQGNAMCLCIVATCEEKTVAMGPEGKTLFCEEHGHQAVAAAQLWAPRENDDE